MTKGISIATIVMGAAWWVLAAGCSEPSNRPAIELSAKPAGQPALDREKKDGNSPPPSKVSVPRPFNIVYLVDRSGSMAPTFEQVRIEILKSVSKLQPEQDFTIILFGDDQFIEGPQKRLVPADLANKRAADNFLKDITATGSTTVLPGLKRAFQVLNYVGFRKPGRVIYLLSDGDFAGMSGGSTYTAADGRVLNGNEAVIQWLWDNNPKEGKTGRVHVSTLLYLSRDEEAIKVMETISKDSGGRFKLITYDE
jgi:hypothetical protein